MLLPTALGDWEVATADAGASTADAGGSVPIIWKIIKNY